MPRKETYSGPISAQAQQDLVSEGIENFELPKSVVMKIAKSSVRPLTTREPQVFLLNFVRIAFFFHIDARKREAAEGNCAFAGERLDGVYQLLGQAYLPLGWLVVHSVANDDDFCYLLQLQRTLLFHPRSRKLRITGVFSFLFFS